MRYNPLSRRFAGLTIEDAGWGYAVLPKNRVRQLENTLIEVFFAEITSLAKGNGPPPREHLFVYGTRSHVRVGRKRFLPKAVFEMPARVRVGKANSLKRRVCKSLTLKAYDDALHESSLALML